MKARRIVVGAHYGMRDFLAQRITSIVLIVYAAILGGAALSTRELTFGNWVRLFSSQWMRVATLVAMLAMIWHAWIGARDIYMDYIKPAGIRLAVQVVTVVMLIAYAFWAVVILWRI